MCTGPRGERPTPRFAIVGGFEQQRQEEARRRGLDHRFVLMLTDPSRAHGLTPGGTYAVVYPLLDHDHETLAILRRAGWQQFDDSPRAHVETSTPDDPASRFYLRALTSAPEPDPEWREFTVSGPVRFRYTPDEIGDGAASYTVEAEGAVSTVRGMTAADVADVEAALLRQQRRGPSAQQARQVAEWVDAHSGPDLVWEGVSTDPVVYRYAGPGEQDPYERPEGIREGDTVNVVVPGEAPTAWMVGNVTVTGPGATDLALSASDGPAGPHLSSDASRSAYAAAGALRDAGEHRDDDLAWPEEWTWGGPAGPVAALVDEDEIADAIRGGYTREEVEAHAPVYAPGTEPRFEPTYRPGRAPWLPAVAELSDTPSRTDVEEFLRSLSGMGEVLDALARAIEQATQVMVGAIEGWRPTGFVNPLVRGGSPAFVVIDEVHEWTAADSPRVSDVVDTSSLAPERPLDPQPSVEPEVRISAWLDVDPVLVEALRRGDSIDLSDRRPQAARITSRVPWGSPLNTWRRS